jgi:hypothetical protein
VLTDLREALAMLEAGERGEIVGAGSLHGGLSSGHLRD